MSDVLMLNKKRSIICSLIPESPIGSPSPSRKPILASYFASITVSELLKFLTSLAYYLSELVACCANCCSECYYCCENHS